jgi:ATP-binding cassette subfamily B (MDR/TAP) protein 1
LKVKEGDRVAFVGSSGCGKSTILQLLLRMYPLSEGEILLDGRKIEDYQLNQLRAQFGVVSQEPVLFNRSVLKNIKYNKPEITD